MPHIFAQTMNLELYISVTGIGPLFKLVTSKNNGLILQNIEDGKSKFYSVRRYQFTPLGTVAVYTLGGTIPLVEVMRSMQEKLASHPPVSTKAEKHEIEEYFETILPDYDEDRVPIKDMKKIIKWFTFLKDRNLLDADQSASTEEE